MRSRLRRLTLAVTALLATGCRDATITHGADGQREWKRRLAAAVQVGIPADSALALLTRNGFDCRSLTAASVPSLLCVKESGRRLAILRRRWKASIALDDQRRVTTVLGSTGLVGP